MNDDLHIRPAQIGDVPVLLGLIRELAAYEKLAHEVVATETALAASLFGERAVAEALLAHAGAEPVGMAIYFHNYSTFLGRPGLYLEDLFVLPAWRGRGYGRRLLARVAKLAIERDCGRMEWSVLDWNDPALRFYEKLGARAMQEWRLHRLTGDALRALADENSLDQRP